MASSKKRRRLDARDQPRGQSAPGSGRSSSPDPQRTKSAAATGATGAGKVYVRRALSFADPKTTLSAAAVPPPSAPASSRSGVAASAPAAADPSPAAAAAVTPPAAPRPPSDASVPPSSAPPHSHAPARAAPRPKALFHDQSLLRELQIDPTKKNVVVWRVRQPLTEILGSAYVRKAPDGAPKISLPPVRTQTVMARRFVRRLGQLPELQAPLPPPPALAPDADSEAEVTIRSHMKTLNVPPLTFVAYATTGIRILPPRSGVDSFTLVLSYPNTVYGQAALEALQQWHSVLGSNSSSSSVASASVAPVSFGRERYICGVLRRFPGRLGAPSATELRDVCVEIGACDLRLQAVVREFAFEGEVKFAVPTRAAHQLALLKGKFPAIQIFKKMAPVQQVCSKCFGKGHTKSQCSAPTQCCKHCKDTSHLSPDCPKLSLARDQWPPCVLCNQARHCVTSCPEFRPQLVRIELQGKKPSFAPQQADFPPAASAAAPQTNTSPAHEAGSSRPRRDPKLPHQSRTYLSTAASALQSSKAAASSKAATSRRETAPAPSASTASAAPAAAAAARAVPSVESTLSEILSQLKSLAANYAVLHSKVEAMASDHESFEVRLKHLTAAIDSREPPVDGTDEEECEDMYDAGGEVQLSSRRDAAPSAQSH